MKNKYQNNIEKIILLLIFSTINFLNLDLYINYLNIFFIILLIISFFFKEKNNTKNKDEKKYANIFIILYSTIIMLFTPALDNQFYLFVYSSIGIIIFLNYFFPYCDRSNEFICGVRVFDIINLLSIISIYLIIGFNSIIMIWFISIIILNAIFRNVYLLLVLAFITLTAFISIYSNNYLNNLSLMYLPQDNDDYSNIGSDSPFLKLKNITIFSGTGQIPNEPYFYRRQASVLNDFNDDKIKWDITNITKADYSFSNVIYATLYNINVLGFKNPLQYDNYYNLDIYKDNYIRLMLDSDFKYFKYYYEDMNPNISLPKTRFIDFFDFIDNQKNINSLSYKPQFLMKVAIPIKKVLTMNTPMSLNSFMPQNTISIKSNKDIIFINATNSLYSFSKNYKYQKLTITYLDSIYVDYRNPYPEDLFISERYKNIINIIAPEIGIKNNDSVYIKEKKINLWFRKNFKYTLNLKYNKKPRTIEDFLLRDRRGHCEFFATATTLISRYYGIPTKYADGLIIDENKNSFSGNKNKEHAWNLFWDGGGWIKVDNTVSTLDNNNKMLISKIFKKYNWNITIKDIKLMDFKKYIKFKIYILSIFTLLILFILYFIIKKYRKPKDYILEKQLRKDLKEYLKKYPKEDYIPWKRWANQTNEEYCINRINQYYKTIYFRK